MRSECDGFIYSSHPLTRLWLEAFSESVSPRIVVVEENGELIGAAPLAISRYSVAGLPIRVLALVGDVEYRIRLSPSAILYQPHRRDVLEKIMREINHLEWNRLMTINMQDNLAVRQYIDEAQSMGRAEGFQPVRFSTISLPDSGDVIDSLSQKARGNTRRLMRRAEQEKGDIAFRETTVDGVDEAVDIYAEQHIQRWQSRGGSFFGYPINTGFVKLVMKWALSHRSGFAYELLIGGEVSAQCMGFIENGEAFGFRLGMNEAFARYSPGWLVVYHCLNDLSRKGVKECHLGVGDERYKQWLGGDSVTLPGAKMNRGLASLLVRMANSPTFQKVDTRLGIRKKGLRVHSPDDQQ